jgi:hypothetical protein
VRSKQDDDDDDKDASDMRKSTRRKLENKMRKLVESLLAKNVLPDPFLVWDPDSSDERERIAIRRIGTVFAAYSVATWYWEMCEMLRKLLLVGLLLFVSPGEPAQIGCGLLITLFFLFAQLIFQPFATKPMNQLQTACQVSIAISLFVGMMSRVDQYIQQEAELAASGFWGADTEGGGGQNVNSVVFSYIASVINVTTLLLPGILVMKGTWRSLRSLSEMPGLLQRQIHEISQKVAAKAKALFGIGQTHGKAKAQNIVSDSEVEGPKKLKRPLTGVFPKPPPPIAEKAARPESDEAEVDLKLREGHVAQEPQMPPSSEPRRPAQLDDSDTVSISSISKMTRENDLANTQPEIFRPKRQARFRELADSAKKYGLQQDPISLVHHSQHKVTEEVDTSNLKGQRGLAHDNLQIVALKVPRHFGALQGVTPSDTESSYMCDDLALDSLVPPLRRFGYHANELKSPDLSRAKASDDSSHLSDDPDLDTLGYTPRTLAYVSSGAYVRVPPKR